MACSDSKPNLREFKSTSLKKLSDTFQGFVDSLADETCFNSVLNVVVNRDHKRELTNRLKIVENLVKSIREQAPYIQESLTVWDEILSLSCDNPPSEEDVMDATRMNSIANVNVDVGGARNPNPIAEFKAMNQGRSCRHYCSHHQEVMDNTLWTKLPREVVQHVCSFLPFSKTLELQKLCKPWSRMPMATNFRPSCAKAHDDLFGMLILDRHYESFRIAVSNSKHTEWFPLELKDIPACRYRYGWSGKHMNLFAHDGGLISILPRFRWYAEGYKEPPSIFIFNPLTGDKKNIPLSSFTSSKDIYDTEAILLQLIVDSETGCYELVLVTQSGNFSREGKVFCSERYDSESKLWSTLDSGFIFGVGVINESRRDVYFDCCSKQLCKDDRKPIEDQKDLYLTLYPRFLTFVKDHRFKIDSPYKDRDSRFIEILESYWYNGWAALSTRRFPMAEPQNRAPTRLFASQRYVLVVANDNPSEVFEHRHQRMLLFDRKTCKASYDIPNFWKADDMMYGGGTFLDRRVHIMCDLKWNVVP